MECFLLFLKYQTCFAIWYDLEDMCHEGEGRIYDYP